MRKAYQLACLLFLAFVCIGQPAYAIEQTKENWLNAVGGYTGQDRPGHRYICGWMWWWYEC